MDINNESGSLVPVDVNITNLMNSSQSEYEEFHPLSNISFPNTNINSTSNLYAKELENVIEKSIQQLKVTAEVVHKEMMEIRELEEQIRNLKEKQEN